MAEKQPQTPGALAKRREKRRLKRERTGDTPEKQREKPAEGYDGQTMADRAARSGLISGV